MLKKIEPEEIKKISRLDAIKLGINKYYTGKECKNGHVSQRYTMSCACQDCIQEVVDSYRENIKSQMKKKELDDA